jgi:methylenetetrahydrofolate dehydrogenase (NADP+)/methenyltetrahydrofolate cyclohydrolase
MKTIIFDGRQFALKKEESVKSKLQSVQGLKPMLISILVGENPASKLYLSLKRKAALKIGFRQEIITLNEKTRPEDVVEKIRFFNSDKNINGIMVQLPLPKNYSQKEKDLVIDSIDRKKDVDGMKKDSPFVTPVVKAIFEIMKEGGRILGINNLKEKTVCVIGARGFVGAKTIEFLSKEGFKVVPCSHDDPNLKEKTISADILISATGIKDIIGGNMIKENSLIIDVGSPRGDVKTEEVVGKVAFISPVPGGVGPITISCLMENLFKTTVAES